IMSEGKPVDLPPALASLLGPEAAAAAMLVDKPSEGRTETLDAREDPRQSRAVYISYVPRLRAFSAHRDGLGEVRAADMQELLSKLTAIFKDAPFHLCLSKVAKAEVAARRKGVPRAEGWH